MKTKFIVNVEMPEDVTITEMRHYIREAVACWKGGQDPEDPIFDLKGDKVTVTTHDGYINADKILCAKGYTHQFYIDWEGDAQYRCRFCNLLGIPHAQKP